MRCGCNEPCFENGDARWGHFGGVMCSHLGEAVDKTGRHYGTCLKDNQEREVYTTRDEYIKLLCVAGLAVDGSHHKQWFLEKVLEAVDNKVEKDWEEGIAP